MFASHDDVAVVCSSRRDYYVTFGRGDIATKLLSLGNLDLQQYHLRKAPSNKIVLATIGSLGDLYPFIALGRALRRPERQVILCVPESHVGAVRSAGLEAVAIMPTFDAICRELGMTEAQAVARIIEDQDFMIRAIAIPAMQHGMAALEAACAEASVIVASLFALAAPVIAEKLDIPLIPVLLQPMTIFSAYDPPLGQRFGTASWAAATPFGRRWNRACLSAVRFEMRRRYGQQINRIRRACGLADQLSTPILDDESMRPLRIGLYSDFLAPLQPDFPTNFIHAGFPDFDGFGDADADPRLAAFLADGPAPLVFTLGSLIKAAPSDFYGESIRLARRLGMRAILAGGDEALNARDILAIDYIRHSQVFPSCAAIVHHGGIGTTGQALRAGRPQVIVPRLADQRDNGARIQRLGVGRVIEWRRYRSENTAPVLQHLLAHEPTCRRSRVLAGRMSNTDGAINAAGAIEQCLHQRWPNNAG